MRIPWHWLAAAVVIAAVVLLLLARPVANLILWLEPYLPGWGAAGVAAYALIYATAPVLMLPTLPFSVGAGILFGFQTGLLAVTMGSVSTASMGFLLSRSFLRQRIEQRIRTSARFTILDEQVARDGWKIVGLIRLTWLHCGFANYAFGLTAIPFRPYILATAAGQIPGNVISVYLGTAGAVGYEMLMGVERERTTLEYVLWGAGTVVAVGVGAFIAVKAKRAVELASRAGDTPMASRSPGASSN